jgi:hypothetical protein
VRLLRRRSWYGDSGYIYILAGWLSACPENDGSQSRQVLLDLKSITDFKRMCMVVIIVHQRSFTRCWSLQREIKFTLCAHLKTVELTIDDKSASS